MVDSSEAATRFTETLVRTAEELKAQGHDQVIVYWHLQGQKQSPYLQELLLKLHQSGIPVMGREISPEDLDRQITANQDFLIPAQSSSASALTFRDRIKELKTAFFGTPLGITFLQHFFRKNAESRWKAVAPANPMLKHNGNLNGLVAAGWYYTSTVVVPHLLTGKSLIPSAGIAIASTIIFCWVRFFWDFAIETATFKTQAKKVDFGINELRFKNSRRFYTLVSLGQTLIVNAIALIGAIGVHNLTGSIALSALTNAVLTTFAFSPMEQWFSEENLKARMLKEQATQAGDESTRTELLARAEATTARATRSFNLYMMVFLPMMRNAQLFISRMIPGWGAFAAMLPLMTVGSVGMGLDIRVSSPDFVEKAKRTMRAIVGLTEGRQGPRPDPGLQGRLLLIPRGALCEMSFL